MPSCFHSFFVHSDLISVEGSIRVISDEFSISLLNPESEAYRFKEQKYSKMVNQLISFPIKVNIINYVTHFSSQISDTYRKSVLKESFVKTVIDGFSSGSLKIFFKVLFDRRYLPP